jgi:DNA uptake protein ComE-like DNA-binding protein
MNQPSSLRRQDQPIQIGPRHGYSIEGDLASINAELQVPPQHSGGEWMLELWATDGAYSEGALTGLKVADVAVDLPTPIVTYVHQVNATSAARLPLQGRAYSMVLALVRRDGDGKTTVDAFANYPASQTFVAPHLAGPVGYQVHGDQVVLQASEIVNPRIMGNSSGSLALELWAFPESGAAPEGLRLAAAEIGCVSGQYWLPSVERRVAFSAPPAGRYRMAMLLCEWTTADGYFARDRRDLETIYERAAEERAAEEPRAVPAAAVAAPVKVPTVATPVAPATTPTVATPVAVATEPTVAIPVATAIAPTVAAAVAAPTGLVSIQTASTDELARVKGLTLKIAKEIVKARPFASVDDLIRVRGIGEKSLAGLKRLLKL